MTGPSAKSWFRVELDYHGAVVACVQVCQREFGSRHIYFVSAASQEEAIGKVSREKRLARLENGGLCSMCGKRPRADGKVKCAHCLNLQRENKKDLARIRTDPDATALLAVRAQVITNERRDSLDKATRAAREVRTNRADARWAAGELCSTDLSAIRRVLKIYFENPDEFPIRMLRLLGQDEISARLIIESTAEARSQLVKGVVLGRIFQ